MIFQKLVAIFKKLWDFYANTVVGQAGAGLNYLGEESWGGGGVSFIGERR